MRASIYEAGKKAVYIFYGHSAGSLLSEVSHELSNVSTEDNERERPGKYIH